MSARLLARCSALLLLAVAAAAPPARSGEAGRPLMSASAPAEEVAFEERVNALAAELRCLVCQNQSLADSNADLALDLKNQVREQLRAGRSERQVIEYMTQRYGDFVLYRPPLKATTVLLWSGPLLMVGLAAALWWRASGSRRRAAPASPPDCPTSLEADRLLGLAAGAAESERRP
jgi:cytochrome c-type biogenesis protein CcmH